MSEMQAYTPVQAPSRIGQATVVEQSRAAAEVMAAVQVALQFPRSEMQAVQRMEQACRDQRMASRAFYSYRRGGTLVTGPTVDLARELARCWGNLHYGISELSRSDSAGQSEMQAWAWDLQTNERVSTTFIVPHGRDTGNEVVRLSSLRDIYEANANAGARRLREQIMQVLPVWFRERAVELCQTTINTGGRPEKPIQQQRADAVAAFERGGVTVAQLEKRAGLPVDAWTPSHLADLNTLFREIDQGTVRADDVFGVEVTDDDVVSSSEPKRTDDGRAQQWPVQQWPQAAQPGSGEAPAGSAE